MPEIGIRIVSAPFPTKWNVSKMRSSTICPSLEGRKELRDGLEIPLGWKRLPLTCLDHKDMLERIEGCQNNVRVTREHAEQDSGNRNRVSSTGINNEEKYIST